MNKKKHNNVHASLSLKRIIILSLAISVGFHFLFMLAFFFGESLFVGPEKTMEKHHELKRNEIVNGADTLVFCSAPSDADCPTKGFPSADGEKVRHKKFRFGRILAQTMFSFIMLFVLFLYNRKMLGIKMKKEWREVFFVILGSFLITTVLSITMSYLPLFFDDHKPNWYFQFRMVRDGMVRDFSLAAIVIMTCYLLRSLFLQEVIAVEMEELRTENIRTHYEALKSQLDPHFLFNSLNTLQSLIEIDGEKAGDYVQQLSSVLRYTLQNKEVVTLADEMNCVQAYCSMMQIRYGDNLRVDFQVDSRYNEYMVLPLSVQGLVENAIKHNVISAKQPLEIRMMTTDDGLLEISNAIQPKIKDEADGGLGLANLVERYRLQWNKEVGIMDDGRRFKVTIPLIDFD